MQEQGRSWVGLNISAHSVPKFIFCPLRKTREGVEHTSSQDEGEFHK